MDITSLIQHIKNSLEKAENGISKLPNEILEMEGMSGQHTRHFYNNLLSMKDARYLEIGVWKGSSTCSAMYGNKALVFCIDNWILFGGPKNEFLKNFNTYKGENYAYFIEQDCFHVDVGSLPNFNIYMYDGDHSEESHSRALTHFLPCLDDVFIFIVDDWNWKDVRNGTFNAIKDCNLSIVFSHEVLTSTTEAHPLMGSPEQRTWHNGIYIAVLQKSKLIQE